MDAKSRANLINSVAKAKTLPCPACGTQNPSTSKFCITCGSSMTGTSNTPAFQTVADDASSGAKKASSYVEPDCVFADGLPEWDIVPPQVMVRRR